MAVALFSFQNRGNDEANWTQKGAPDGPLPAIDKEPDEPEDNRADDDEFHDVSLSGDCAEGASLCTLD